MPSYDFFEYVLSPGFLITFGLVAGGFAPLGYSLLVTWLENGYKVDNMHETQRRARQARIEQRRHRAARRQAAQAVASANPNVE